LDVLLPDGQGYDLCREIQGDLGEEGGVPVIFLTGKTTVADKFLGFSVGADDYVTKPFDPAELMVRVDHMILRYEKRKQQSEVIVRGPLKINLGSYAAFLKNETGESRVDLTPVEFKLLLKLAQNPNRVMSREQLIDGVWGNGVFIEDRSVDKHISAIRKKLHPTVDSIKTISGVGYEFQN
jgi:two-component system phosphate regulon response regulator PhoB